MAGMTLSSASVPVATDSSPNVRDHRTRNHSDRDMPKSNERKRGAQREETARQEGAAVRRGAGEQNTRRRLLRGCEVCKHGATTRARSHPRSNPGETTGNRVASSSEAGRSEATRRERETVRGRHREGAGRERGQRREGESGAEAQRRRRESEVAERVQQSNGGLARLWLC